MESKIPRSVPSRAGTLNFTRTVDRSLIHRWALSEVFLTDARSVDESEYLAAAQLPPWHAYYSERFSRLGAPDPLLLLECARQAETYGGHAFVGAPRTASSSCATGPCLCRACSLPRWEAGPGNWPCACGPATAGAHPAMCGG